MRPGPPVRVSRDDLVVRELRETLQFERVVGESFARFGLRDFFTHERKFFGDHLLHLGLELYEVLRSEWLLDLEVVIEAVFDGWSESDLRVGTKAAYRGGEYVRAGVSQHSEGLRILFRQNPEVAALSERGVQIQNFAIYFDSDGVAQKPGPNGCDNVARQRAFGSFTGGAVGEPQRQHFWYNFEYCGWPLFCSPLSYRLQIPFATGTLHVPLPLS